MNTPATLKDALHTYSELELAVLIGSQVLGSATAESDWDIAYRWKIHSDAIHNLQQTEILKQHIADAIHIHRDKIDLIKMSKARLTMRAVIAEEVIVLKGENSLAWHHFLSQTWAKLEDYYWRLSHVA